MSTFKKEKAPLKPTRKARSELTEEQKQEIKEAFDLFDTDGVGTPIFTQDTSMPRNLKLPCELLALSPRRKKSKR
jgi:centrin-1